VNYSHRMRAWARETQRLGGEHWDQSPAWDALSEGEQETVRMTRRYRSGCDASGRIDERGSASELVAKVLSEAT